MPLPASKTCRIFLAGAAMIGLSACATMTDDAMMDDTMATTQPDRTPSVAAFDFPPASAADPMGQDIPFSGNDVDAGNQAVIDALLKDLNLRPYHTLTPEQARQQPLFGAGVKAVMEDRGMSMAPPEGLTQQTVQIPGADGLLDAIVVRPATGTQPRPLVVYFHGGGWVLADAEAYIASARALAKKLDAVVVSVNYRRAPQYKFPAQHNDAFAAYRAVRANAASLGGDPDRMVLAGESAGGNLAVATAIRLRDVNEPLPDHILSVYPVAGTNLNTESYQENANALPLNRAAMAWFFHHTINGPQDLKDGRLDLVSANLRGLPPVTIVQAEVDPLRSEGRMLADRLRAAGVDVDNRVFEGATHEFFGAASVIEAAEAAQDYAVQRIKGTLR